MLHASCLSCPPWIALLIRPIDAPFLQVSLDRHWPLTFPFRLGSLFSLNRLRHRLTCSCPRRFDALRFQAHHHLKNLNPALTFSWAEKDCQVCLHYRYFPEVLLELLALFFDDLLLRFLLFKMNYLLFRYLVLKLNLQILLYYLFFFHFNYVAKKIKKFTFILINFIDKNLNRKY